MIEVLALILGLSAACNYPIYRMLAADPNVVSRRRLYKEWQVPEAITPKLEGVLTEWL